MGKRPAAAAREGLPMAAQRVRIIDIAQELGVSTATVSNVIHGKTKKISDQTVRRVQEALERRQYVPSMAGILLAQNSSRIVGAAVSGQGPYGCHPLEDSLVSAALSRLSAALQEAGYFLMVLVAQDWREIPRLASMWNMEGVIVMGFSQPEWTGLKDGLSVPLVVLDGASDEPVCGPSPDDFGGGRLMGEHFREMGYRRTLCLASGLTGAEDRRFQGFQEGLGGGTAEFFQVPADARERRRFCESQLDRLNACQAIFALSDTYAAELAVLLQEKGLRIPEDVAVAGFGDTPLSRQVYPPLTTIRQDWDQQARQAVEQLRRLRQDGDAPEPVPLPLSLVPRRSTLGRRPQMQRRARLYP